VQTFQLTKFPRWWEWILTRINPSHIDRSAALTEDLRRIGVIAAAGAPAAPPRTEPQQPRRSACWASRGLVQCDDEIRQAWCINSLVLQSNSSL
jgi:hypothetical protein